jgi:hypothetical protein
LANSFLNASRCLLRAFSVLAAIHDVRIAKQEMYNRIANPAWSLFSPQLALQR